MGGAPHCGKVHVTTTYCIARAHHCLHGNSLRRNALVSGTTWILQNSSQPSNEEILNVLNQNCLDSR